MIPPRLRSPGSSCFMAAAAKTTPSATTSTIVE